MTSLEILFIVLFSITFIIAVVAIFNAIKIDIDHAESEMQLLTDLLSCEKERFKLSLEIEKLKEGEKDE